ncbi:helix-turn-helix transcriptional regulator [Dermabacter hominis]|uniref:helix-turn-helix transcriptional regulator n=1 Tax=Dermabacter hominis TaxID=36740 RepID=UPI0021A584E4|nr:helix-turn-helix domain-containing protein [Dermabacter hominis]MCT1716385.1 helix-turn-helix domain-containing protein [Dermabacter hominis]MDU4693961.1 helix-turn-helix domain-containing protein [Dermabacter sp.]
MNIPKDIPRLSVKPSTAAEMLGLSRGTLANWRAEGRGPRYIKLGKDVLYRVSDIESWLDAQPTIGGAA